MTTEERFCAAVNVINSLPKHGPFQPSQDLASKLYAYEQQAKFGSCNIPKPLFYNLEKRKWNTWKELGNMSKETAMEKYIEELSKVIEAMSYTEAVSKFMDIMPPFYEMVWENENQTDFSNEMDVKTLNESTLEKNIKDIDSDPNMPPSENTVITRKECVQYQYFQEDWSMLSPDKMQLFNNGYPETLQQNCNMTDICSTEPNDLMLTILDLQKSLDSIVYQLNSLENMAQAYRNQLQKISAEKGTERNWKFSALMMVILSCPFIAYWLLHLLRRRRVSL